MNEIILASSSPRRLNLLRMIGMNPEVIHPRADENEEKGEALPDFLCRVTMEKGRSVTSIRGSEIPVISADTVVILGGEKIGKPGSRTDAEGILTKLSGRMHEVWTGVAIGYRGEEFYDYSRTRVWFAPLTKREINEYLDVAEYMDKAGAYAIQGRAALFVQRIEGCYFNVMGFPLRMFYEMAGKAGIDLSALPGEISGGSDASR